VVTVLAMPNTRPSALHSFLEGRGIRKGRAGVGHGQHRHHPAGQRRRRPAGEILFMGLPWLPQVHMDVRRSRQTDGGHAEGPPAWRLYKKSTGSEIAFPVPEKHNRRPTDEGIGGAPELVY